MSRLDIAEHLFRAHPNEWISALTFEASCGRLSWRTRISDLRRQRGMVIDNRLIRRGYEKQSEYRFVPTPTPQEPALDLLMAEQLRRCMRCDHLYTSRDRSGCPECQREAEA